jgi:hypothetical protein
MLEEREMLSPVCMAQNLEIVKSWRISKSVARQLTRNGKMSTLVKSQLDIHACLTLLLPLQAQETFARAFNSACGLSSLSYFDVGLETSNPALHHGSPHIILNISHHI